MDVYLPKVKGEEFFQLFSTDIDTLAEWFNMYEIDSIELKIDGAVRSCGSKGSYEPLFQAWKGLKCEQ